jgi:hypothetical protein
MLFHQILRILNRAHFYFVTATCTFHCNVSIHYVISLSCIRNVIALEKNLQDSARTPKKRKKRQKTRFLRVFGGQAETQKKGPFWAFLGPFYLIKLPKKPHFSKNARKTGVYRGVQKNVIFHVFLRFLQKIYKKIFY